MANPTTPIPPAQQTAFGLAVCRRLGIDPAIVSASDFAWEVTGGDDQGWVQLRAFLPADELLDMFNSAGRGGSRETPADDEAPTEGEVAAALDWLMRVHDSNPSQERLSIVRRHLAALVERERGAYENGESSGYADWALALNEVLPDDIEPLPSVVAEWIATALSERGEQRG